MSQDHRTTIASGRLRGKWFARCSCGFESPSTYDRNRADLDASEHRVGARMNAPAPAPELRYTVGVVRASGLEARWNRTSRGAPIIEARRPGGEWYAIDRKIWNRAAEIGIAEAFDRATALGSYFSIPA